MSNNKTIPHVIATIALIALHFTAAPRALAQQAADAPPPELPSNQETGVDIDRFIGDPYLSLPNGKTTHSSMNLSTENPSIWLYISRRVPQD